MSQPEGTLTAAQHEIMDIVWDAADQGRSVTEIWESLDSDREVARTTVLNQVDRLEKRGWLKRQKRDGSFRYSAVISRAAAAQGLTEEFVASFFAGSASGLVSSLLDSQKLKDKDIRELRDLLDSQLSKRRKKSR